MKFIPANQEEVKPVIDLYRDGDVVKTRITYPTPERTADEEEGYDDENREDL